MLRLVMLCDLCLFLAIPSKSVWGHITSSFQIETSPSSVSACGCDRHFGLHKCYWSSQPQLDERYSSKRSTKLKVTSDLKIRSRDLLNSFEQISQKGSASSDDKNIELLILRVDRLLNDEKFCKQKGDEERGDGPNLTELLVPKDASSLIRLLGRHRAHDSMLRFCRRYCCDLVDAKSSNTTTLTRNETISRGDVEEAVLYCYTAAIAACSKPSSTASISAKNIEKYRSKIFLLSLLDEMEQKYTSSGQSIWPNSYTLSAVLLGIDDGFEALDVLEHFEEKYGRTKRLMLPSSSESGEKSIVAVQVYNAAIAACGRSFRGTNDVRLKNIQGWQLALSLFQRMKRHGPVPNDQTFLAVLKVCAQYGQVRVSQSILDEISHTSTRELKSKLYKPVLEACTVAKNAIMAEDIIERMKCDSLKITTEHMNLFLLTLAKCKMKTRAFEVLHEMRNLQSSDRAIAPDIISLNTVLLACANAEDYEAAKELLDEMKEGMFLVPAPNDRTSFVEILPDVVSYNTVISCSDPEAALDLINDMRLTRRNRIGVVTPNSISYTNAIARCRKASTSGYPHIRQYAYNVAFTLFKLAQENVKDPNGQNVDLNVFVFSSLIWVAEAVGDYVVAVRLLRGMKCTPNRVCYDGVISALSKRGLHREVLYFYYEMQKLGLEATRNTYLKLSYTIKKSRDPELYSSPRKRAALLEGVLSRMSRRDRSVEIGGPLFELLITCHSDKSEPGSSYAASKMAFDKIVGPVDDACISAMLRACASSTALWKEAIMFLHCSDIVRKASGPGRISVRALSHAVIACAKANQWEEALNLIELYGNESNPNADTMSQNQRSGVVSLAAMNSLIGACGRSLRPDVAVQLLNDMQKKYGVTPDVLSYRFAIIACNQAEHRETKQAIFLSPEPIPSDFTWWECALSLLRRMVEDGLVPDSQTYSSVVSALESAGQWQRAIGVLQSMPSISSILGNSIVNNADNKLEPHELPNLYCLNAAISACEKGGAWVEALQLYESIRAQEKTKNSTRPNFITINSLSIALDKAGQTELAMTLYEDAVRDKIVDPWKLRFDIDGTVRRMMDLHKFSAPLAKTAVMSYLNSLLVSRKGSSINSDAVFIVGKGKGSKGEPVLMPTIMRLLTEEYGLEAEIEEMNSGRIRVSMHAMYAFVTRKRWKF